MNLGDGDAEVDADGQGGGAGEQTYEHEQAAEEFRESGEISAPSGKSEAGDKLNVVMKPAKNLVISVSHHHRAEGEAHDEKCEGLQAIEVAQEVLRNTA